MGAQQAYEWAVRFPEAVERLAAIAGTARTTPTTHSACRLAEEALLAGGLELHARAWVPFGLSAELFRTEAWREAGFASVDDLVARLFEDDFAPHAPGQPRCQCRKWRRADVSRHTGGDLAAALARIRRETFVIPFSHDLLFPVEDCAADDGPHPPQPSCGSSRAPWGHYAFEMTPTSAGGARRST